MWIPLGCGKIAALAGPKTLDMTSIGSIPTGAEFVMLRAETQDIRWRDDGTDPTASEGMLLKTTDAPLVWHGPLTTFLAIAATAGAVLRVNFYKAG